MFEKRECNRDSKKIAIFYCLGNPAFKWVTAQYNGSLLERNIIGDIFAQFYFHTINFQFQDFVISTNFVEFC